MSKKYLCPNKHIIDEVPASHKEDFLSFKCSNCSKEEQCDYVCSDIECLFLLCFDCYILEDDWVNILFKKKHLETRNSKGTLFDSFYKKLLPFSHTES